MFPAVNLIGDAAGGVTRGLLGGARRVAAAVTPTFQPGNLDDRDPDYMRETLPGLWLLVNAWFRPKVHGLQNVPEDGPVLIVGNHTGGAQSPEVFISQLALSTYFGVERPHYQLAHRMVLNSPLGPSLARFGTVEADANNATMALEAGAMVTVFPGGDYEVFRPSWESAQVDFGGRKGFIKLALAAGVPIVPMVTIGGQETALFLSRGEWLASALRLDRTMRLKTLPIRIALPWGLAIGAFTPHIPLPAKITIRFLEPIDLRERYGPEPDVDRVYDDLIGAMQEAMDKLASERRLPVIG